MKSQLFRGEQKGTSTRCWVVGEKDNGGVGCCGAGKCLNLAVRGLSADKASSCIFLADAFSALAGFGAVLFRVRSSPPVFWAVGLRWAGVWKIMRRTGNGLVPALPINSALSV